jgi:hypothetical protein
VRFFIPETPSSSVSSVDLYDKKYLKYGNDELRINLGELGLINANSDVTGQKYYNDFRWSEIMGERSEEKVELIEVEIHKVDFE